LPGASNDLALIITPRDDSRRHPNSLAWTEMLDGGSSKVRSLAHGLLKREVGMGPISATVILHDLREIGSSLLA
jgi:hypothetical protein